MTEPLKLLLDMNLAQRWVAWLEQQGHAAVHWITIGQGAAPDTEIMAYAKENDLIVLTHDLDFGAILAATQGEKPSVIQIRAEDTGPEVIGGQVLAAVRQLETELIAGALVTVEPSRSRLRLLPLRR